MPNLEVLCRTVRKNSEGTTGYVGALGNLRMSALNDAVSKAFTGKPYSQAIALERATGGSALRMPPPHVTRVAAEYGLDRNGFAAALSRALHADERPRWQGETLEERNKDRYVPFPEHEKVLEELAAQLDRPVNGDHVAIVGDFSIGTSTILRHFRFQHQADAWKLETPRYFGRFVKLSGGIGTRLENWTQDLYLAMSKFGLNDGINDYEGHLRGKLAFREAIRLAGEYGVDTIIVEDLCRAFRPDNGKDRLRFGKALSAFAATYPFRLVMGIAPSTVDFDACAPSLARKTVTINVPALQDSAVLREWIELNDAHRGVPCLGAYDDEMVEAILSVSRGVTLLIGRYVRSASSAIWDYGWQRSEVRSRLLRLGAISKATPNVELPPGGVDRFLSEGWRKK